MKHADRLQVSWKATWIDDIGRPVGDAAGGSIRAGVEAVRVDRVCPTKVELEVGIVAIGRDVSEGGSERIPNMNSNSSMVIDSMWFFHSSSIAQDTAKEQLEEHKSDDCGRCNHVHAVLHLRKRHAIWRLAYLACWSEILLTVAFQTYFLYPLEWHMIVACSASSNARAFFETYTYRSPQ